METIHTDVVIIGAGFTGLACAYYLQQKGYSVKVVEVSSSSGGRARTDNVNGFLLDRGTHFYHHSTTELKKIISIDKLGLKNLYPGYLLRYENGFHLFTNPLYKTFDTISTVFAPNATVADKMRLFGLYVKLKTLPYSTLVKENESSTYEYLSKNGFSSKLIDTLFRPLVAANIFDYNLQSSSRFSKVYLKSLFQEHVALPKEGIGSVAKHILDKLKPDTVMFNTKAKRIHQDGITCSNGKTSRIVSKFTVIATNPIDTNLLMQSDVLPTECSHVSTLYFYSENPPLSKPVVVLNGNSNGMVNHIFVPTNVHPKMAPEGKHLIAVSVVKTNDLDDEELPEAVMKELTEWFGLKVMDWTHLKTYHIKYAMPFKPILDEVTYYKKINDTVYACGDSLSVGSMEAALRSGRETAQALIKELKSIPA
ncbi:MAG TPA: FAD-dependent oxidoreductase [Chitinophagales bacterium]|nr:FAD-dependent oxidoreductase [Chitinophagales bacterium]HNL84222.1 FAD-dependent oxidoreductase [Chitinophagales bacterium]